MGHSVSSFYYFYLQNYYLISNNGRATWAGSVEPYIKEGEKAAREWLRTTGFENIDELNKVIVKTASPWTDKV